MAKKSFVDKVQMRKRMVVCMIAACLVFIGLSTRLGYVMFVKEGKYKTLATQQWTSDVRINAKRGKVLDRNGVALAVSANVYRADLDLNTLRTDLATNVENNTENVAKSMEDVARGICDIVGKPYEDVLHILTNPLPNGKPRGAAILKRRIEKNVADALTEFSESNDIRGIVISSDTKRYYPNGDFASHIIGHTNSDGDGLTGLELYYNKYLAGVPGIRISEIDQKSEDLPYTISEFTEPIDGRDVTTTLDENIQYVAEKLAAEALSDNEAKAVSITVMDPHTGEILALANAPDYDLNTPWPQDVSDDDIQAMWRNRMVNDAYEPGSIFKVVTATAAIQEGLVSDADTFNCSGGLKIGGRSIHCWKTSGHGPQNFVDILKNSCNVGFMVLGERLGAETLTKYIKLFGLGRKTGIDLPGESAGLVKNPKDISVTDLATISFGQTNTATGIQYMRAFNAIANGGYLITPHLMKQVTHLNEDGELVIDDEYEIEKEKVLDSDTMEQMRLNLEQVVASGGASKAYIDGYRIGGKTGTAQKVDTVNGGYARGKYLSTFVGMAPADNPQFTVYVSIDEPNPYLYYAGQIAAPVGQKLFNELFNYAELKPTGTWKDATESLKAEVIVPEARKMSVADGKKIMEDSGLTVRIEGEGDIITDMNPKPGYIMKEGNEVILYAGQEAADSDMVIVPDLKGFTKESIEVLFKDLGLQGEFVKEGVVVDQSIEGGQQVKKGTVVTFTLGVLSD